MGRRPPHRRLTRLPAGLLALALLASACTPVGPATGDPHAGALLAERLNAAARDRTPTAFLSNFAGPQAMSVSALRWYRFMTQTGATASVPPGGSLLEFTWTLPGDRGVAKSTLATIIGSRGDDPVITGVRATEYMPIWAIEAVDVTPATHGTVVSSGLSASDRADRSRLVDRAADVVAKAGVVSPKALWNGSIVVVEPANTSDFRAVSGMDPDGVAGVATCDDGTPRIVMNPAAEKDWFEETLVHETVHVATDSPCSDAAVWATEGLAEWVTQRAFPEVARDHATLVRDYLRENPLPDDVPNSVSSLTDYALAAVAVDQVFAHLRRHRAIDYLDAFIRRGAVGEEDYARVAKWYLAELKRLKKSG